MAKEKVLGRDGLTGLVVLATSLVLFALTLDLKDNPLVPVGPGFYPRIVLGLTAVLAAALIAFDVIAWRRGRKAAQDSGTPNYRLVLAVFALFGLYVAAIPYFGFRVATFVFVGAMQSTLEMPRGLKGWLVVAITAAVTTVVAYFVFEHFLQVLLPRGRWTGF
jgi:putative tricarboxylic transport membrane protein